MNVDFIIGFARQGMEITLLMAAPVLGVGMVVGLLVSIFQSVTQIQEMTLTFVPKILAVMVALLFFGPWMLAKMMNYTESIIQNIPTYIK
ncbi:flagellar biosynthetic protein FliQ [Desulfarculus baarsii DSM 2075]|uniref:Flagellar biosynthetic protein FliQ n=1 Tax=Desulfarculus baarsii (strain ATCC 33931 / DSM 2075 / LMG 7858 / VKM B-1802 / 2st14) TaxID=644282 RepID=E1QJD5_DESB2|nr:flagellar biosynthesis protein FliQ [Desulfarculus baarsii]ADK85678.1 flagellar biosynthetic protein FliQ [Desulfarculus baarsii DSM 2075]